MWRRRTAFPRWAVAVLLAIAVSPATSQPDSKVSQQEAIIEILLKQPAPPPDWREHLSKRKQIPRSKPAADAPIDELTNYWRAAPEMEVPDEASRMRLLEACEAAPNEIGPLLTRLPLDSPEGQDRLKRLYDRLVAERRREDASEVELLREALMTHSHYFRDELLRRVFLPTDFGEDRFDEATAALLRLDREGARQLYLKEATSSDLMHRVLALSNLLQHFAAEADALSRAGWQNELKRIAADPKSERTARRFALLAVMSAASAENEQWFLDLFRDPTLSSLDDTADRSTLLGDVVATKADYWIPKVAALVGNKHAPTHANAVYALIQFQIDKARADALRPLLPWLENPRWAPDDTSELRGRLRLVQSLDRVDLPEAVPGLLKVVETASDYELEGAADALAHYNARGAIEPLKRALKREKEEHHRRAITRALLKLEGLPTNEMVEALKLYALKISTAEGEEEVEAAAELLPKKHLDPRVSLGKELARSDLVNDELSAALLQAADRLARSNSIAADILRNFVARWQTPTATKALGDRLRAGDFTAEWVAQFIEHRARHAPAIGQVRNLDGAALGIQAALTAESSLVDRALESQDRLARLALLAVARLARVELPVPRIAPLLSSNDKALVQAAELYLEANDTPAARNELWRHFSGKAVILGARTNFDPGHFTFPAFDKSERSLREAILRDNGPQEIYALLSEGYWGGEGQRAIFIEKDRAVLRSDDGNGRSREREVPANELKALVDWLASEQIEDLPPFDTGTADGIQWEFVRLHRDGGRRVFMNNPPYGAGAPRVEFGDAREGPEPAIYGELTRRLKTLTDGSMRVVYNTLANLPGFQVVHSREKGEVVRLRKQNDQLSAGIRLPSQEATAWHRITETGLSEEFVVEKKEGDPEVEQHGQDRVIDVREGPLTGKRLLADWGIDDSKFGLWALQKNRKPELIAKGTFARPILGAGGEWVVAAFLPPGKMWDVPNGVVRIHLRDKRIFPVDLPPADTFNPVAWIEARKRVLLYQQREWQDGKAGPEKPEFYLLDPVTGNHEKATGELRPFFDAGKHQLQATGKPNEFWATLHSSVVDPRLHTATIGRFESHDFRFTPLVTCPEMEFDSASVFVDEPAGLIWIAVNGDLLRLSLPGKATP